MTTALELKRRLAVLSQTLKRSGEIERHHGLPRGSVVIGCDVDGPVVVVGDATYRAETLPDAVAAALSAAVLEWAAENPDKATALATRIK